MNSISIVVPCRNEVGHIRLFLESLLCQDLAGLEWEIIVADGMSDDGTRHILEEYAGQDPKVRVIDNPGRIASTGLNAAIRAARGDIIVRMDVHTEYAPDYVRQCVAVLEETGADNAGGPARTRAHGLVQRAIAAAYRSRYSTGGARFHDDSYEGPADTVAYGCWRKETLLRAGLFDGTLVRNQDDEFNLRLARMGGKIWQSPRIVSWYRPRSSLRQLFRQYFQYGFWKVAVIRKHKLPASWRHLVPGATVLLGLVLPAAAGLAAMSGSPAWAWLLGPWIALCALYAVGLVAASITAAHPHGWDLVPILPLVFVTYHLSYGLGFLAGLAYFPCYNRERADAPKFSTELTR